MARRRAKKRTHVGAHNGPSNAAPASNSASRAPKNMVIRIGAGEIGPSVSQLVKDVRSMMEPGTASRLKERRTNRLRDYTTMAGPLGVSHLLLFSRSSTGNTNLRLALTPRGPTLHFRVEKYSLCKDILKAQKHPKGGRKEYLTPPLLVMNNFMSPTPTDGSTPPVPKHLETLTTTVFQSLFPPISPQITPLSSIYRVLLLNRETPESSSITSSGADGSYIINLRHFAITTKRIGLSKGVRRLNTAERMLKEKKARQGIPNLGRLEDVADYLLNPSAAEAGFTSGSESEIETDAEVEVVETDAKKVLNKKQLAVMRSNDGKSDVRKERGPKVEKRVVKLVELGPRLKLRMTKVEEGICGGKVMWHEYLEKSGEELKEMERVWERRRMEKEERKRVQKENVQRKQGKNNRGKYNGEDEEMEDGWDSEKFGEEDMELEVGKENMVFG